MKKRKHGEEPALFDEDVSEEEIETEESSKKKIITWEKLLMGFEELKDETKQSSRIVQQMHQKLLRQEMSAKPNRWTPSKFYNDLDQNQKILPTSFEQYNLSPLHGWIQYGSKEELLNILKSRLSLDTSEEPNADIGKTSELPVLEYFDIDNTIHSNEKLNSLYGVRVIVNSFLRELSKGKRLYMESEDGISFKEADQTPLCRNYSLKLDAYRFPTYQNRKPDFVANVDNYVGAQAIVLIGDFKPRANYDFTKEQKGKVIDFARTLLFEEQFHRHFMFCFLSDGVRFQFFRVEKIVENGIDDLRVRAFPVVTGIQGWQILFSFLNMSQEGLGYRGYFIEHIHVGGALGRGGFAEVFRGKLVDEVNENLVLKIYIGANAEEHRAHEAAFYEKIQNLPENLPWRAHVPTLLGNGEKFYTVDFTPLNIFLPIGSPIQPKPEGVYISGMDMAKLVLILQSVHSLGIIHCDIKPDNIFMYQDYIFLNDWGCWRKPSTEAHPFIESPTAFAGDPHYFIPSAAYDLVSLVKTCYTFVTKEYPTEPYNSFWGNVEQKSAKIWGTAFTFARNCDYENLSDFLIQIKPV